MENNISFEKLPQAVAQLLVDVGHIKQLLIEKGSNAQPPGDQLLPIEGAAALLHLTVPTVYGLVHRKEIPVMKKGKRLYFSREELTQYIKSGRKKTTAELTTEAETEFLTANKKR